MVKFIVITFFFIFLASCGLVNNDLKKLQSEPHEAIKLPSKKDVPFVEKLSKAQIFALKTQIKADSTIINNLSPNQVLNLLGTPVVIKKSKNLQIWQFRSSCILNIVWGKEIKTAATTNSNSNNNNVSHIINNANDSNNNVDNNKDYAIVWLESLNSDKKELKAANCFYYLANIS